jgi:hypothetical protein
MPQYEQLSGGPTVPQPHRDSQVVAALPLSQCPHLRAAPAPLGGQQPAEPIHRRFF